MRTARQNARRIRIGATLTFLGFLLVAIGGWILFSLYTLWWANQIGVPLLMLALLLGPAGLALIGVGFKFTFGSLAAEIAASFVPCSIEGCSGEAEPMGEHAGPWAKPLCRAHSDDMNEAMSQIPHSTRRGEP